MSLGYRVLSAPDSQQRDLVVDPAHSTVIHLWSPSLPSHVFPTTLITGRLRMVCKQLPLSSTLPRSITALYVLTGSSCADSLASCAS